MYPTLQDGDRLLVLRHQSLHKYQTGQIVLSHLPYEGPWKEKLSAALDAQAEYEMYNHFTELVAGHTTVLISHRFSTVRMADKIAVLENGRITEHGSHDTLLSQNGTYAKLYRMQAEKYAINVGHR